MSLGLQLFSVPLLIGLNAFFVAAEYAVVASRPAQIEAMRRTGRNRAAVAMERLRTDPSGAIGAIQVCITMTNLLLGWIGEPAMSKLLHLALSGLVERYPGVFGMVSLILSFLLVTFFTVVFSELLPKALTLRYVPQVAGFTAIPILGIRTFITPLVWLMNAAANLVTRPLGLGRVDDAEKEISAPEEIRFIASRATGEGTLSGQERSLILNALSLGRRQAKQIMVPRVRVDYLDIRWSIEENMKVVDQHLHSRMPLCDGGMDQVIGTIATRKFLTAYYAGGDIGVLQLLVDPPMFEPDTISLHQLLVRFDDRHTQMIMLVDEHGGVEGVVTLRDVVDELVGDPLTTILPGNQQGDLEMDLNNLDAGTSLRDVASLLGRVGWPGDESVVTIGGLMVSRLNRVPHVDEHVVVAGVDVQAVAADHRAVRRVRVTAKP